jgi:chromosomal replication initiation ATPase DnaA
VRSEQAGQDWLENRYVQLISACVKELTGHDVEIKFIIKDEEETENETLPQPQPNRNLP